LTVSFAPLTLTQLVAVPAQELLGLLLSAKV
jgi:hypothetical protein